MLSRGWFRRSPPFSLWQMGSRLDGDAFPSLLLLSRFFHVFLFPSFSSHSELKRRRRGNRLYFVFFLSLIFERKRIKKHALTLGQPVL